MKPIFSSSTFESVCMEAKKKEEKKKGKMLTVEEIELRFEM